MRFSLIVVLIINSLLIQAQTADLSIKKLLNAPIIDGVVDPIWDLIDPVVIDAQVTGDYGDATIESYFKMGWNDTAIFVLVYRNDDDFASQWQTGLSDWQSDRDELYFDVFTDTLFDGRGSSNPNGASCGHYQFTSLWTPPLSYPAPPSEVTPVDTVKWPNQWYHNAPYKMGNRFLGANAYYCEYAFPFSSLKINPMYIPSVGNDTCPLFAGAGTIFGFAVSCVDVDMYDNPVDETTRRFLRWGASANCDAWINMDNAGYIYMSPEEIGSDDPVNPPVDPPVVLSDLVIKKFNHAPEIDGVVDPVWNLIDNEPIEITGDLSYADPTLTSYFKMGWNDTALFLLVYRNDDDFANRWETGLSDWQSDRDEIFFDVNIDDLLDGRGAINPNGASYGHYQFTSLWLQDDITDTTYWPEQWYHNAPFKFGYRFLGSNSYYSEYCFPFSSLKIDPDYLPSYGIDTLPLTNGSGTIFGFAIANTDVDMADAPYDETFRKFMRWESADSDPWNSMDKAGTVLMSAEYIDTVMPEIPKIPDLIIKKLGTTPKIDGKTDKIWNQIDATPIDMQVSGDYGNATVSSSFKMGWNDTALFILVKRIDDDFANLWETGLYDWSSDRDELFFDVNINNLMDGRNTTSIVNNGANYGHYQFNSNWLEENQTDTSYWPLQGYHFAPYQLGYTFSDDNSYVTEYCFPFSSLEINTALLPGASSIFPGDTGNIFGFAIRVVDVDLNDNPTNGNFRKFLYWSEAQCDGFVNMDSAAHIKLGAEVVNVPVVPIVGIKETRPINSIFVYPVPANNEIYLTNRASVVEIFDITGKKVLTKQDIEAREAIDISNLENGMYLIRKDNVNSEIFIKK